MNKKVLKITALIIALIVLFAGLFIFVMAFMHSVGEKSTNRKNEIRCFIEMPAGKCGFDDESDERIKEEMEYLKLSPQKTRELILEAQKHDKETIENLSQKNVITDEEKWILEKSIEKMPYYERVLKILDSIENNVNSGI